MFLPPISMKPGMVIPGIVGDHDDPSRSSGAAAVEGFQEDKEGGATLHVVWRLSCTLGGQ